MAYKNKKFRKIQPLTAFAIIVGAALAVFLIVVGIMRLRGMSNTTVIAPNGNEIKYVGLIDKDGHMISGTLYYQNGIEATIDAKAGTVTYSDGTVYRGSLDVNYHRTGKGSITWENGDSYEGDFLDDELTGSGIFRFANGDIYEGELNKGQKDGTGKYTAADGSVYEGGFKDNKRHGKGKHTSPEGDIYEGDFVMDVKEGQGKYFYANGDSYEGGFVGDLREGKGKYIWANGETYTGDFAKGNMNGYGTYTWPTGRASYTGYFENGLIVVVKPQ